MVVSVACWVYSPRRFSPLTMIFGFFFVVVFETLARARCCDEIPIESVCLAVKNNTPDHTLTGKHSNNPYTTWCDSSIPDDVSVSVFGLILVFTA